MAITQTGSVLNFGPGNVNNTGTVSTTITVPSDATLVLVGVSGYASASTGYYSDGGMTFTKGGVDTAMTAAMTGANAGDNSTSFFMSALFYLALPDTGTNKTLKWDWEGTAAATDNPVISVIFFKGVDTTTPRRSGGGIQASGLPYTTNTITAQSGDLIVAFCGFFASNGNEGSIDSWTNLTEIQDNARQGNQSDSAWASGSPSGNTTVAAATGTNVADGGITAICLIPAAEGSVAAAVAAGLATGVGKALFDGIAAAAAAAGSAVVGAALVASSFASAGVGGASGTGAALFSGTASSVAAGSAAGVGAALFGGVGASAGVGEALGVGASSSASTAASAGTGLASGTGAALADGVASSVGSATATGVSTTSGVGASAGVGAAAGIGASLADGVASATGSATAAGVAPGTNDATGAAAGVGVGTGVGSSLFAGTASSTGSGAATGTGAALAASAGAAAGSGSATGIAPSLLGVSVPFGTINSTTAMYTADTIDAGGILFRLKTTAGVVASTTQTQAGGTALVSTINEVSVCTNANDTVTLPTSVAGMQCIIINNGAQTLRIYPFLGDNLGAGVDTFTTLASGSNVVFTAYDAVNWEIT